MEAKGSQPFFSGYGGLQHSSDFANKKFTLTTFAITKKPVPGLPAYNSRQKAQTSVATPLIAAKE